MSFDHQIIIRQNFYCIQNYCLIPANLNLPILFNTSFGQNLMTANIFGYIKYKVQSLPGMSKHCSSFISLTVSQGAGTKL